jgi:serine/threonine-protein kinase
VNYTDPFVLRGDVLLIPCADLSEDTRSRFAYDEGDVTLSQRHGRAFAQVIDRNTAALLELFRQPRTIVDAVLESSRASGQDAEAWFEALLPHIGNFVDSRVLVPAGTGEESEIRPQFDSGTSFAGYEIVRCASLVDDSEVYQLRGSAGPAALKIARADTPHLRRLFGNEAAILRHLDGAGIAPRLLESGRHGNRPYLIAEWIPGIHAGIAAAQRRGDRPSMAALCASIAAAYATLHERGVLHADVHAGNVLVDGSAIKLVDFGYARFIGRPPRVRRAGTPELREPELVMALRRGRSAPASPAGEQYALAALLYSLIAGTGYLDFRYDRKELARQIETECPRSFAAHGMAPWPEIERILFRALEKTPSRRHASVAAMARRFAAVRSAGARRSRSASVSAEAHAFLDRTLQALGPGGETYAARYPTASVAEGCAGAAAGLLRIAEVRGDPALLALAEVWQSRAAALAVVDENDIASAFYGLPGVHATGAMIAAAANDPYAAQAEVAAFVDAANLPCATHEILLGRLGNVLAAALLLDAGSGGPDIAEPLRTFGGETLRAIWRDLDGLPTIDERTAGVAHGWSGYLYATMRWCAASGDALPPRLAERLDQLASLGTIDGWAASWCNGSAGQLFTFLLAHRLTGGSEWLRLAEDAAWSSWKEPRGAASLCCGTAGRAYALLGLYAHSGDRAWLGRACELANHAAAAARETSQRTNALWKGELGAAVLIADLASPENARMPFFA